jgi:hypothetical protein
MHVLDVRKHVKPDYRVSVPEGESGEWRVERFEVSEDASMFFNLRQSFKLGSRTVTPGSYTRLVRGNTIVMSDTPAEVRDHWELFARVRLESTKRVLMHGLGLGMALQEVLRQPHVEQVDVVEISEDVIRLVGPHYRTDPRLVLHHGDALTYRFPRNTRWDVVWHDIWDNICVDNLPQVTHLKRRYGTRCDVQFAWCEALTRRYAGR